jgi:formylglycine-generating enzyme required for sulfatase activity
LPIRAPATIIEGDPARIVMSMQRLRRPVAGVLGPAVLMAVGSCQSIATAPPPLGEVRVVADTDAPVPRLVGRLRVDLYTVDGGWYATRDVPAFKPADWPVDFAVTLGDGEPAKDVVVRLRGYPQGKTRDYRGERFAPTPDPATFCALGACFDPSSPLASIPSCCPTAPAPAATPFATSDCPSCPRLLGATNDDVTPASEPGPSLAIDALAVVHVTPGRRSAARIVLRGACFGTMADLYGLRACVDTAGQRVDAGYASLDDDTTVERPSALVGTWGETTTCTATPRTAGTATDGTPLHDAEACVPGQAFVLGTRSGSVGGPQDDLPERVVAVRPFLVDRYEVTVARFRKALADGFSGGQPVANDGPLVGSGLPTAAQCTWSSAPMGREEYPMNCVTGDVAAAFCSFEGGGLPTEAQWELASAVAGRPARTYYPWGDGNGSAPPCDGVVYGRSDVTSGLTDHCHGSGWGPAPVGASEAVDVTPLGVVGLAGSVAEWTADSFASPGSACWMAASLVQPGCNHEGSLVTARGGAWTASASALLVSRRSPAPRSGWSPGGGFRCVRPGAP